MKKSLHFGQVPFLVILIFSFLIPQNAKADVSCSIAGGSVFINEIHYDNAGGDVGEFIEVAGPALSSLAGYSIALYNGSNGTVYNTINLSGVIDDECASGMGAVDFQLPANGLQNGAPDGMALVDPAGMVIQFLSYEGTITATAGPANGMTSTDIGVAETGTTPIGSSLHLTGMDGCAPADFTWTGPAPATPGTKNTGQTFLVPNTPCTSTILLINELHYDNAGGDVNEGVEIAGTAGTDLMGYTLVPYNGSNGTTYSITNLSGIIPDEGAGFGAIFFPIQGLQNGAPDGVAFVDPNGMVLQFINYEGTTITATNGPATGMTSTNIGVQETSSTPIGESLQVTGTGSFASSFTWQAPLPATPGLLNVGQTLECPTACTIVEITTSNISACMFAGGMSTFTASVTVTFAGAPATGTLDLSGAGTASVPVAGLTGSTHTFTGVTMPANGMAISLTATFSDDMACTFTKADAGTAPGGCMPSSCAAELLFINEFHYDNQGGDVGEFIEVAGTSGINLVGYSLVLYNGSNGSTYNTINLSGVIDNEGTGFGAVDFQLPSNGLQNGAPDGMALVNSSGCVLEFISYEGDFVATAGPAAGMMSMDVGVPEFGSTPIGQSLQLTGTGSMSMDFSWTGPTTESPGTLNAGQTLTCPTACNISSVSINNISSCSFVNGVSTFTADVKVLFVLPPTTGTLELTGDAMGSIPVTNICGNIATFSAVTLPANGGPINLTVAFSDDAACTLTAVAGTAPAECCPPEAVCQDAFVTLSATGDVTLDPLDFDGGTMFCAEPTFSVAPSMFTCTDVGPQTVTLTATDPLTGITSTCTATANIIASQFCIDNFAPITTNSGGPTISDPCTCAGNGLFDEEVFIQSNSPGQMWTISILNGLAPWTAGDIITDNGDGTYSVVGQHADAIGFNIELESIFWPGLTLGLSNVCYYPKPVIENDFNAVCTGAILETLVGNAGLQSDGVTPIEGTGVFKINGVVSTIFDPLVLGAGTHTVEFCFDAGEALGFAQILDVTGTPVIKGPPTGADSDIEAQDNPGCETCITEVVTIDENPNIMACNDLVNVSITDEGCSLISSDAILEGDYLGCYDAYIVERVHELAGSCGGDAPRGYFWVNCADVGNTITLKVIDPISGNFCWGDVHVEDKVKPVLECEVTYTDVNGDEQVGTIFNLTCSENPDDIDLPTPVDNCDRARDMDVNLLSETTTGDVCNVVTITRVYQTGDQYGNASNTCTHVITVTQPNLTFPDDITWACEHFSNYPNVINPTRLNIDILEEAAEIDTSLLYCGIPGSNGDDFPGVHPYDTTAGAPLWWTDAEDLDINYNLISSSNRRKLQSTGSGEPNVVGIGCRFSVTHLDQKLEACDGVDTTIAFKILRTWTVLNWCTGDITSDLQIIKVIDKKAPVFSYPVDHDGNSLYDTELTTNQSVGNGKTAECFSSGLVSIPTVTDDCSGVENIRLFTPAGEGLPVLNNNGDLIAFSIPSPYLSEGAHDLIFEASDACGNTSRDTIEFNVIDATPPTPICRELTQVSLAAEPDGVTTILARDLDEGSYDDCGPVFFKVRRMDDNCPGFSNDRRRFNDEINFCCEDIGDSINVILRVYDVNPGLGSVTVSTADDHSNDCMVQVLLDDKIIPECYAPADVWLNCDELPENVDYDDDAALDALFGTATVLDNCNAELQYVSTRVNLDLCGVGNVTRTFRAEDDFGNRSLGSCRQVIMVQPVTNYCITFPSDYEGECDNNNAPDDLTFVETGCDLIAVNVEERPFNAGGPAGDECRKVIRVWRAINWCEYDGISAPTKVLRDGNGDGNVDDGEYCSTGSLFVYTPNPTQIFYPSTGYYEWSQHVKIFDNTAPEVSYDGTTKFCGGDLDEDPCNGLVDIEIDITELCTNELTTTWAISAFSSTFASADFNGSDAISMRLPLGTHTARFLVTDDCGNTSQIDITFSVVDCKAPTPVCFNGLSIDVMPASGMVELWASDFDASSFDYCSDYILRINIIEDTNGDGFITSEDHVTTLPADNFIVLDCDDVADGTTMVQLWVAEQDGTADDACADNQDNDYCTTFVQVQDNNGVCSNSKSAVAGKITNENHESVENVTVEVNAGPTMLNSMVTNLDGAYEFVLPIGGDYSITPMKNDDVANGVSTFDLVLMSKHILNVRLLDSPYKVLAADANRSGGISTLDLVAVRKVVLRLTNEFPNNTSWRFVEKSHLFTDANNPWNTTIPELTNINNLDAPQLEMNFTAIKVGDVNGDSKANGILGVDDRTFNGNFEFKVEEQNFKAGEQVKVVFNAEDLQTVDGYQFTIKFNEQVLELVTIENGVATAEHFGTAMAANGYITSSWNGTATDNEAFTMIFIAKANGTLSNEIAISSALTNAEAYEGNDYKNVSINFGSDVVSNEFALYQNTPNPFKGETVIGFDLPKAAAATLTVSDVSGKILKVVNGDFAKGYNTFTLSSEALSSGVLYYQLDTEEFTKTMKMVVIK